MVYGFLSILEEHFLLVFFLSARARAVKWLLKSPEIDFFLIIFLIKNRLTFVVFNNTLSCCTWNPQCDVNALLRRWNLKPATYISYTWWHLVSRGRQN